MVKDGQVMLEYNFIIFVTELLERAMERESFIIFILMINHVSWCFPVDFYENRTFLLGFWSLGFYNPAAQVDVFATGAVWCQLAAGSRAMSFFRTWGPGNMEKICVFIVLGILLDDAG